MYDFYFGTNEEIAKDEEGYLIGLKHLLPRWINSIPDSQYLQLNRLLMRYVAKISPILVETGVGASTIVLLYHAMKYDGILFSWDISSSKGSAIRSICAETIETYFHKPICTHWRFIASSSISPFLGISVLKEMGIKIDFSFHDSDHTWETLGKEIDMVADLLNEGGIISIDDANYKYRRYNIAYINMLRKKLGLLPVKEEPENICGTFADESEKLLLDKFLEVKKIETFYDKTDLFFEYYSTSRRPMLEVGMEKRESADIRFQAWQVGNKSK